MEQIPPNKNPFEAQLERKITNANSIRELRAAVAAFYEAGRQIKAYSVEDILDTLHPAVPPNKVTRAFGLRERFQELTAEPEQDSQYESEKLVADEWIAEQFAAFADVQTWSEYIQQCHAMYQNIEAQEQETGTDFSLYKYRVSEWITEAQRLAAAAKDDQTLMWSIAAMQKSTMHIRQGEEG